MIAAPMPRQILDDDRLHPAIRQQVADRHADIVHNVQAAASSNAVLVVGMGWNPHVARARRALTAAGIPHHALSFGTYLSPAAAVRIGLVPKLPVLRFVSAGNVAGEGAKMALLSQLERAGAQALLGEGRYVELSDRADFNDKFVDQLAFPS